MSIVSADTISHLTEELATAGQVVAEHTPSAHAAAGHAAEGASGAPHIPNFITLLYHKYPDNPFIGFLHYFEDPIFAILIGIGISIVAYMATKNRTMIPGKLQNVIEMLVEALDNLVTGIVGPQGRKYTPLIGTLFLYIWLMNLAGLIPFLKAPTSSWNITVALAICVFFFVQGVGIKHNGILGYLYHMAGSPQDVIGWVMVPLMFPLHILGEFIKPVSLSLRLFGNIFGEDLLIAAFIALGVTVAGFVHSPVGPPLQFPFLLLGLLTCTVQALVFSLLSAIYIFLMLPHTEHAHEDGHHH